MRDVPGLDLLGKEPVGVGRGDARVDLGLDVAEALDLDP